MEQPEKSDFIKTALAPVVETVVDYICDTIAPEIIENENDIAALEGRMDTAESDIDALEERMDTAEGDISDLETRMNMVEGRVDAVENRIETVEQEVDDVKTTIDDIDGRLDSVESGEGIIKSVVNTYNNNQLVTTVNGVASDPVTIEGGGGSGYVLPVATADALGGVKIGEGIAVTEDGTISVTGEATGIDSVVNSIANNQLITTVNGVSSAPVAIPTTDISELETRVTTVEGEVDDLKTGLDTAEGNIESLQSQMTEKAEASAVNEIGISTSGNTATVNGKIASIVNSVSGSVSGSNLRVSVNGVQSANIALPGGEMNQKSIRIDNYSELSQNISDGDFVSFAAGSNTYGAITLSGFVKNNIIFGSGTVCLDKAVPIYEIALDYDGIRIYGYEGASIAAESISSSSISRLSVSIFRLE